MVLTGRLSGREYMYIHLRKERVENLRQVLASYLGHFKHADSYNLVSSLFTNDSLLKILFSVKAGRLVPGYVPVKKIARLKEQYEWFRSSYSICFIFFQVGKFVEFYGEETSRAENILNLKAGKETRELGKQAGFPVRLLKGYKRKALLAFLPYIVVGEEGCYPSGLKKRAVTEMLTFRPHVLICKKWANKYMKSWVLANNCSIKKHYETISCKLIHIR